MTAAYKLVIIRHGESEYTQKNLFCGFAHDADLTDVGIQEAKRAGQVRTFVTEIFVCYLFEMRQLK